MVRGLSKTRAKKLCDPPCLLNTKTHPNLEREMEADHLRRERQRERFKLSKGYGKDGGELSNLEECVCVLACQYLALCVIMVKREVPKLSMKA